MIAIVIIIIDPPISVYGLGCSFMTTQTHIGPSIVSNKKKRLTSAPVINLGAIVTRTKGIATHITHIKGIKNISLLINAKFSTKKKANIATINFPKTADGTKSLFFAYLAIVALHARPNAVRNPKNSNKIS